MHLPYLDELPQFEIAAISDLSRQTTDALAARYRVPVASQDFHDVIAADVDIVAVLSPNHREVAADAIEAGRDVFVEKPLTFDSAEALELVESAKAAGVVLAVGYMKFHDRAYQELRRRVASLEVRLARVRVMFGRAERPTRFYSLVQADDVPAFASTQSSFVTETQRIGERLGLDERRARMFVHMLNLGCHDLAVLRGVMGEPNEVLTATAPTDESVVAVLSYASGARAIVEIGEWPRQAFWDERLEVVADEEVLTLDFGNPWVRYSASRLRHARTTPGGAELEELAPAHYDAFREQWLHLYDVFANGAAPRATGRDAVSDIALAEAIVRRLP